MSVRRPCARLHSGLVLNFKFLRLSPLLRQKDSNFRGTVRNLLRREVTNSLNLVTIFLGKTQASVFNQIKSTFGGKEHYDRGFMIGQGA